MSILLGLSLVTLNAHAAKLKSFCVLDEAGQEVKGLNVNQRLPIASVSKVFTSLLTISQNRIDRKLYTEFYFTPVGSDTFDVHIKGSRDPYFGRSSLQWLISKLNEAGVIKIRNFTFDENFKFYFETDRLHRLGRSLLNPVSGKYGLDAPTVDEVKGQLKQLPEVFKFYDKTYKMALASGVTLTKTIKFRPLKIEVLKAANFKPAANTKKGYVSSPEILHMLKLMNWNSNNHVANQLFQVSGGIEKFNKLFYDGLKFKEEELRFINGSGQNAQLDGNGRLYNEATCTTVVKTVRGLKKTLEAQKAKLQDVMAVVGGDVGSTVSGVTYHNPITNLSVIAKTGTVGTNITLAGMISAKKGNYFFFFNVDGTPPVGKSGSNAWLNQEAKRARTIISTKLNQLVVSLGGGKPIDYKIKRFDLENFEDEEMPADGSVEVADLLKVDLSADKPDEEIDMSKYAF